MAKITQQQLQAMLEELPIGYYAGDKVDVEIDADAETSYFNPMERKISISLQGANELSSNGKLDLETATRGHLYHELSHAILTPQQLPSCDWMNIFEDERIETLLDGYYHKVNFKENVKAYAGYDESQVPINDMQKFFAAVRFRIAKPAILKEIDRIIERYADLNWNSARRDRQLRDYYSEVRELYNRIASQPYSQQMWEQMVKEKQERDKQAQQNGQPQGNIPSEYGKEQGEKQEGQAQPQQGEGEGEQQNGGQPQGERQEGNTEPKDGEGNPHGAGKLHAPNLRELLNQTLSAGIDKELFDGLDAILENFNKKNKGGSSLATYSGIFNPRNVTRDDYRYFDRRATVNGSNPFGTLHLNLFIDESGSFYDNEKAANVLIRTLVQLERKHKNFSVDFCWVGDGLTPIKDKRKAILRTGGGNDIPKGSDRIFADMQKRNTYNYNILLMDGWTNSYWERDKGEYFPFDFSNTTFILDPSCADHGGDKIRNGKVIYCRNYVQELYKHIILTLQRAFR